MSYRLVVNPADIEWQNFVASSQQGNIFSDLRYLKLLAVPFARYLVKSSDGQQVLAGVAVLEDGVRMREAPFPFTPYQGILYGNQVTCQANHKRVVTEGRLTEFLIQALLERYGNFSMALSPKFTDLRPFLWHNYGQEGSRQFAVKIRYTATLNLKNFSLENYLSEIRSVRRQEIRRSGAEIKESVDVEHFLKLYALTFSRQGLELSEDVMKLVERIVQNSIADGYGRLVAATTHAGVASMTLFVHDQKTGYYLFGANNPELRSSNASAALMLNNFQWMAELGLEEVDFVGVNSPNRGDYKLSFNPKLRQYHEVHLK